MAASQGPGMNKWANLHYATEPWLAGSEHLLLSLKSWVRIPASSLTETSAMIFSLPTNSSSHNKTCLLRAL